MLLPLLLGQGAAGPQNYTLSVDPASFTLTYSSVTFQAARQLSVTPTSYSYTPANPSLTVQHQLPVTPTSFSYSTANPTLTVSRQLPVTSTSYTYSHPAPTLTATRQTSVTPTSYTVTTSTGDFTLTRVLQVTGDSLSVTFSNVTLDYFQNAKQLLIDPAAWALTFSNPALSASRQLSVAGISASVTFSDPTFTVSRQINVSPGHYDIIAASAQMTVDRKLAVYPAGTTYVEPGYVESGYVGLTKTYSLDTNYVTTGYVTPGYVNGEVGAGLQVGRALSVTPESIVVGFSPVMLLREGAVTPEDIAAAVLAALMAQATPVDVVEVNGVLVTGDGTQSVPWGPTAGSFGGSYSPPANIADIVNAVLASINATVIPVNIAKINTVTVTGAGTQTNPWGPL